MNIFEVRAGVCTFFFISAEVKKSRKRKHSVLAFF